MEMKKILWILLMSIGVVLISTAQDKSDEPSDYQSKSFIVQQGGQLNVDVEPGSVRIEPWSKDEVFVEAEGIDERNPKRLEMRQSGNTISIEYRDRRRHTDHLQFIIKVPERFNVFAKTSGGSIKQRDKLSGDFKAETGGGSVSVDEIIGNIDLQTGGGSIKTKKIQGNATLHTGGGSIDNGPTTGTVKASTGGGSVSLKGSGGKVSASTGGGSIKMENADSWIDLSTGGGGVTVIGAKYGAKVRTGGGSIEMEDITGVVQLSTGGGSIKCELSPGSSGNSSINTGGGDIQLILPEKAKAIVDATINLHHGWGRHFKRCKIRSDFKADTYEGNDDSDEIHAVYTLNGGGPTITLETSNSDIEISKR
jgi:DUF4097 and DUF4098 domain-containing protein YvlB